MEIWKLLIITLLSAVVLGSLAGVFIGKYLVKRNSGEYRPLLSLKEKIIYGCSILLGFLLVALGIFYIPSAPADEMAEADPGMMMDGALYFEQDAVDVFAQEGDVGGQEEGEGEGGEAAADGEEIVADGEIEYASMNQEETEDREAAVDDTSTVPVDEDEIQ